MAGAFQLSAFQASAFQVDGAPPPPPPPVDLNRWDDAEEKRKKREKKERESAEHLAKLVRDLVDGAADSGGAVEISEENRTVRSSSGRYIYVPPQIDFERVRVVAENAIRAAIESANRLIQEEERRRALIMEEERRRALIRKRRKDAEFLLLLH
jgi:type IV secretory pathway VirB10-like protein